MLRLFHFKKVASYRIRPRWWTDRSQKRTIRNAINGLVKSPNLSMSGSATKTELAGFECLCIFLACEIHVCFTNFQFFLIIFGSRLAQLTHLCSLTTKAFTSPLLLYLMTHFFQFLNVVFMFFFFFNNSRDLCELQFLHYFIDFSSIYFSLVNA